MEKECNCNHESHVCDESCNCEEKECECCQNENPTIIELEDESGNKVNVQVIGSFEDQGKTYAVVNDLDNEENSYIFEVQSTEQGDLLVSINDEKEFERLCKVVEKITNENIEK